MFGWWVLIPYRLIPTSNNPEEEGFGKTEGKGENAGTQHFLLFPLCFQKL